MRPNYTCVQNSGKIRKVEAGEGLEVVYGLLEVLPQGEGEEAPRSPLLLLLPLSSPPPPPPVGVHICILVCVGIGIVVVIVVVVVVDNVEDTHRGPGGGVQEGEQREEDKGAAGALALHDEAAVGGLRRRRLEGQPGSPGLQQQEVQLLGTLRGKIVIISCCCSSLLDIVGIASGGLYKGGFWCIDVASLNVLSP